MSDRLLLLLQRFRTSCDGHLHVYFLVWIVVPVARNSHDLVGHIHTGDDVSEYRVISIKETVVLHIDEKLAAARTLLRIGWATGTRRGHRAAFVRLLDLRLHRVTGA